MTIYFTRTRFPFPSFVTCLKSFPNLHTLLIGAVHGSVTTQLKKALKCVKLPQIKTLILPPAAHLLLKHCRNVEEVFCVCYKYETVPSDGFLIALTSNRKSKIKRLAIPLVLWPNPSRKWSSTS